MPDQQVSASQRHTQLGHGHALLSLLPGPHLVEGCHDVVFAGRTVRLVHNHTHDLVCHTDAYGSHRMRFQSTGTTPTMSGKRCRRSWNVTFHQVVLEGLRRHEVEALVRQRPQLRPLLRAHAARQLLDVLLQHFTS